MTMAFADDEERWRVNVFDWQVEFPQVFDPPPGLPWCVAPAKELQC
ncbi:MAG: hypothetical protein AB1846_08135 [Chloroflexota bacterium]